MNVKILEPVPLKKGTGAVALKTPHINLLWH